MSYNNLPIICFSSNWNNKLYCDVFTTLRIYNPTKYQLHHVYNIHLGKHNFGRAEIVNLRKLSYMALTEGLAWQDTGKPLAYLKTLLSKFYPNTNWSLQPLHFIQLKFIDNEQLRSNHIHQHAAQRGQVQTTLSFAEGTLQDSTIQTTKCS